jgi:hypothetical protein
MTRPQESSLRRRSSQQLDEAQARAVDARLETRCRKDWQIRLASWIELVRSGKSAGPERFETLT